MELNHLINIAGDDSNIDENSSTAENWSFEVVEF